MTVVDSIELSGPGHEVAAHPELPIAYVPIYSNAPVGAPGTNCSTIDVVDLLSGQRRTTIDLKVPCRPHCAVFGKDGLLYVTTEVTKTITVLDPLTLSVVRTLDTGHAQSHMLALSADNARGYTANVEPGSISEVDLETGALVRTIEIGREINRISLSMDGAHAFTADQRQPRLAVVDIATGTVARWVDLPSIAFGTALTHDGLNMIVALREGAQVARLDLRTFDITAVADVPPFPQMMLLNPEGTVAYTASAPAGSLTSVRLCDMSIASTVQTGRNPDGIAFSTFARSASELMP